jgi:hypothetical protein
MNSTQAVEKTAVKYDIPALVFIPGLHIASLFAIPYFSWDALAVCLFGLFIVTPFGVNLGFHRLISHRSLKTPKWLEYVLVTIGRWSSDLLGCGSPCTPQILGHSKGSARFGARILVCTHDSPVPRKVPSRT